MNENINIEYEIRAFNHSLTPFGYKDVEVAVRTALEGGHDGEWVAEQVEEFAESTDTPIKDIDVCYVVYDSLFQEARNDIDELINIDILNDTENQVDVYGNYMCSSLDYNEEAQKELEEIIKQIEPEDLTDAIKWLCNETDIEFVQESAQENKKTEE